MPPIAANAAISQRKDRLHILVQDEAGPDQPAEAEYEGEPPNDARDCRLVCVI